MARLFIAGATGFIGKEVLRFALNRGFDCRCLVREGSEDKLITGRGKAEVVIGELPGRKSPYHFLENCDVILNLVGIIREERGRGATFQRIHVDATHVLVESALKRGIKRFLFLSANGADPDGITEYHRSKGKAERIIKESRLNYTIFKPSIVWGDPEGRSEFFTFLKKVFFKSRFPLPFLPGFDGGGFELSPVFVGDLAAGIVSAIDNPHGFNRVYHVGGSQVFCWNELLGLLREVLEIHKTILYTPSWILKPFAWLMQKINRGPLTLDQLKMLLSGNVCDGTDFFRDSGIIPTRLTHTSLQYLRDNNIGGK